METGWKPGRAVMGCIAVFAIIAPASAQTPETSPPQILATGEPFGGEPVTDTALKTITGRENLSQQASAKQTAGVSSNSVGNNVQTGNATIDGSAFQNMSGLSVLSVNTGNNVAINAAMNVNIAINPAQ